MFFNLIIVHIISDIRKIFLILYLLINSNIVFSQNLHKCFTANLLNSPASTEFLQKGGLRYSKFPKRVASSSDLQHFFVRNVFDMSMWDELIAKKIYSSDQVVFWMDSSLVGTMFNEQEIDSLNSFIGKKLLFSTSSLSEDSTKGILELEHNYFGSPPDVDGDGILDILFLDIRDDFTTSGSFVAGFFDPNDLLDNNTSNKRDMLYIDVYPLIKYNGELHFEQAASTIAHEYQHLIHAHYERFEAETIFINEGLSEYAETFCGFPPRSGNSYNRDKSRSLLSWNYNDPIPDYSRASLWTEYFFQRIGKSFIKHLVQSPETGIRTIKNVLALSNNTFSQIFNDWTLANFLNNESYPPFFYAHPYRKTFSLDSDIISDRLPSFNTLELAPNSCSIIEFSNVYELFIDPQEHNENLSFSALVTDANGTTDFVENIAQSNLSFSVRDTFGASIKIMVRNTNENENEGNDSNVRFSYLATGIKSGKTINFIYDDGIADNFSNGAKYFLLDSLDAVCVKFYHPEEANLEEISVKGIFLSETSNNNITNNERDIYYQIFSIKNNMPDTAITEMVYHIFNRDFGEIGFETISLTEFYPNINTIKDTFCIVIQNDYDDDNYFAIGLDNSVNTQTLLRNTDSLSNSSWKPFTDIVVNGERLSHWNAMIRCKSSFPLELINGINIEPELDFSLENISISFISPFIIDTSYSSVVLLSPNRNYFTSALSDNINPTVTFKYDGAGNYKLALSLYTQIGFEVFDTLLAFTIKPPEKYIIGNNYPNPFHKITKVPITLYENCDINLQIFNVLGQLIQERHFGAKTIGKHIISVDMSNFASSVYFLRFKFIHGDFKEIKLSKVVLIR